MAAFACFIVTELIINSVNHHNDEHRRGSTPLHLPHRYNWSEIRSRVRIRRAGQHTPQRLWTKKSRRCTPLHLPIEVLVSNRVKGQDLKSRTALPHHKLLEMPHPRRRNRRYFMNKYTLQWHMNGALRLQYSNFDFISTILMLQFTNIYWQWSHFAFVLC